ARGVIHDFGRDRAEDRRSERAAAMASEDDEVRRGATGLSNDAARRSIDDDRGLDIAARTGQLALDLRESRADVITQLLVHGRVRPGGKLEALREEPVDVHDLDVRRRGPVSGSEEFLG